MSAKSLKNFYDMEEEEESQQIPKKVAKNKREQNNDIDIIESECGNLMIRYYKDNDKYIVIDKSLQINIVAFGYLFRLLHPSRFEDDELLYEICEIAKSLYVSKKELIEHIIKRTVEEEQTTFYRHSAHTDVQTSLIITKFNTYEQNTKEIVKKTTKFYDSIEEIGTNSNNLYKLCRYAMYDNPAKYKRIITGTGLKIEQSAGIVHLLVASLIEEGIKDDILCKLFFFANAGILLYDDQSTSWFMRNESNFWNPQNDISEIFSICANRLCDWITPIFNRHLKYYEMKINYSTEASNFEMAKKHKSNVDAIKKKFEKLKNKILSINKFKDVLLSSLFMFKDIKFMKKRDQVNKNYFAFYNGLYDFGTKTMRKARADEYITSYVSYRYKERNEIKNDVFDFINKKIFEPIVSDSAEREFLLTIFSLCLQGKPEMHKFFVLKGRGRNGKSILSHLMSKIFDTYFYTMNIAYLDEKAPKRDANAADEILYNSKGARICFTSEPNTSMRLDTSKIKRISGQDIDRARKNYGSLNRNDTSTIIDYSYYLFFLTNYDLEMNGSESVAMSERLCVFTFKNQFCREDIYDKNNKRHKLIDVSLRDKIENMPDISIAFFHILLDYLYKYLDNGKRLFYPASVLEDTRKMSINCESFHSFYTTFIRSYTAEKIDEFNRNGTLKDKTTACKNVYAAYTKYCSENGSEPIKAKEFKQRMEDKGHETYEVRANGVSKYKNVRIRDKDEIDADINKLEESKIINDSLLEESSEDEEDEQDEYDDDEPEEIPRIIRKPKQNLKPKEVEKKTKKLN
jgi:phage/plasmid-associated DNA primase